MFNVELIRIDDLKVDSSYQRHPDEKRVKRIAREWDDLKANLVHVSKRKDGYYVIDGNHTRLAYKMIGGEKIACRVHENLTIEDEARLFSELNTSTKKPSFSEILRAKATAGYELEKSYLQLLDAAGIPYTFDSCAHGCEIKCHSALVRVYKKTTYETMFRALTTAKAASAERKEFWQVGTFPGLCDLVVTHPEIDDMRLIACVQKTTSAKVREIADKYRRGMVTSGSGSGLTTHFRNAYAEIYNKGLKKNKVSI